MKKLTKKDFLKERELKTEIVPIPEWNGEIIVREMTGTERDEFDEFVLNSQAEGKVKALRSVVVSICCVDEEGKRMFTNLDVPDLQKISSKITMKISDVALKLSGMAADDVEDREKNLKAGRAKGSSSGSVGN